MTFSKVICLFYNILICLIDIGNSWKCSRLISGIKCKEDTVTYKQIIEKKRTFTFIHGLNKELDEVRGRIMGVKPFPSLEESFSEVRREESRRKIMLGPQKFDSGATDHMTGDRSLFSSYKPNNNSTVTVLVADGSQSKVMGTGSIILTKDMTQFTLFYMCLLLIVT